MVKMILSLEEIANSKDYVLLEACAIKDYFKNPAVDKKEIEHKLNKISLIGKRFNWWLNEIGIHDNIYLTNQVFETMQKTNNFGYKKRVHRKGKNIPPETLKYGRHFDLNRKLTNKFLAFFEENERIFNLKEDATESYFFVSETLGSLKKDVVDEDFDLLVSAEMLNLAGKSVAILSKNIKIFKAYNKFFDKRRNNLLSFYVPEEKTTFKEYLF